MDGTLVEGPISNSQKTKGLNVGKKKQWVVF
jgi:hypothetical protein